MPIEIKGLKDIAPDEIEVTPDMIEAGASKFLLFEAADADVAVFSIFRAMLGASRQFRNCRVIEI